MDIHVSLYGEDLIVPCEDVGTVGELRRAVAHGRGLAWKYIHLSHEGDKLSDDTAALADTLRGPHVEATSPSFEETAADTLLCDYGVDIHDGSLELSRAAFPTAEPQELLPMLRLLELAVTGSYLERYLEARIGWALQDAACGDAVDCIDYILQHYDIPQDSLHAAAEGAANHRHTAVFARLATACGTLLPAMADVGLRSALGLFRVSRGLVGRPSESLMQLCLASGARVTTAILQHASPEGLVLLAGSPPDLQCFTGLQAPNYLPYNSRNLSWHSLSPSRLFRYLKCLRKVHIAAFAAQPLEGVTCELHWRRLLSPAFWAPVLHAYITPYMRVCDLDTLLSWGYPLNAKDSGGLTALWHVPVARPLFHTLLERGADPHIPSATGASIAETFPYAFADYVGEAWVESELHDDLWWAILQADDWEDASSRHGSRRLGPVKRGRGRRGRGSAVVPRHERCQA